MSKAIVYLSDKVLEFYDITDIDINYENTSHNVLSFTNKEGQKTIVANAPFQVIFK